MIKNSTLFKTAIDDDCYEYVNQLDISTVRAAAATIDFNAGVKATLLHVIGALESDSAKQLSLRKIGYIATDDAPNWANFIRDLAVEILEDE